MMTLTGFASAAELSRRLVRIFAAAKIAGARFTEARGSFRMTLIGGIFFYSMRTSMATTKPTSVQAIRPDGPESSRA
jgi:hypothetical protein